MKLVLQIAAGVVLGGIILDLAHFIEGAATISAAVNSLPQIHFPSPPAAETPRTTFTIVPTVPPGPQPKPCEVRNARGEVFRC